MRIRRWSGMLAACMAMSVVAGCRGEDKNISTPGSEATFEENKPNSTPREVTVTAPGVKVGVALPVLDMSTYAVAKGATDAGRELVVDAVAEGPTLPDPKQAKTILERLYQERDAVVTVRLAGRPAEKLTALITDRKPLIGAGNFGGAGDEVLWFGPDERESGRILGRELRRQCEEKGHSSGTFVFVVGAARKDPILLPRREGLREVLGPQFNLVEMTTAPVEAIRATPEGIAYIGAETQTLNALVAATRSASKEARRKTRMAWLIGGFNPDAAGLTAIKNGEAHAAVGQHPYLFGYLPVLAAALSLGEQKPLPQGWIDTGSELITRTNVDAVLNREGRPDLQNAFYHEMIQTRFRDFNSLAKPRP